MKKGYENWNLHKASYDGIFMQNSLAFVKCICYDLQRDNIISEAGLSGCDISTRYQAIFFT